MQNNETSFRSDSISNALNDDTHMRQWGAKRKEKSQEIFQLLQQWHRMESKWVKLTHEPKLQPKHLTSSEQPDTNLNKD